MARTATHNLSSKTSRAKLKPRAKAYFTTIEARLALGYVRRSNGATGRWIVQREVDRTETGPVRRIRTLGLADDHAPADGVNVLTYDQAFRAAATGEMTSSVGPLTVRRAVAAYLEHLATHKGERAASDAKSKLAKHVLPALGDAEVAKLTQTQLNQWFAGLVQRDPEDADKERRSKDTANRILATFKASLNLAFQDEGNRIPTDKAWRTLKAFKGVGAGREDHFSEAQIASLIRHARKHDVYFAALLEGAFHTGARYGELQLLDVRHFDPKRAQIHIPDGKTGDRDTTLTAEGVEFFKRMAKGKQPGDVLLPRADGERWGKSEQHRPMKAALKAAKLPESASIYTIRHSYISRAIERGMPLTLIAENVGTSVRMIEQNYGKFIAQTRRELIEKHAPTLRPVTQKSRGKHAAA